MKAVSDSIIKYFHLFCCNPNSKRYLYADMHSYINDAESISKEKFPSKYNWNSLNYIECDYILRFYALFSGPSRQNNLFLIFAYRKVFFDYNIKDTTSYLAHYYGKHIEPYSIAHDLTRYVKNLNKYPGLIILLYFLCKEMRYEDFYLLFCKNFDNEKSIIKNIAYKDIVSIIDSDRDVNNDVKVWCNYKQILKEYFKNPAKCDFDREKQKYETYCEILNNLLFFAIWENSSAVSYLQEDPRQNNNQIYKIQERFKNYCESRWDDVKARIDLYNNLAKEYEFVKENPFENVIFDVRKNNQALAKTVFYLSRTQREVEDSFPYLISYIGELKNQKFKDEILNKKSEKLNELDFGFNVKSFKLFLFPFIDMDFKLYLSTYFIELKEFDIKNNVKFKLFCESDKEFDKVDNKYKEKWKESITNGFDIRYLYKDRNMIIHSSLHNTVNELIDEKYWYKLLYALHSYYKYLDKNFISKIEDSPMKFSFTLLKKWVSDIFDELCQRLDNYCSIGGLVIPNRILGCIDNLIKEYNDKIKEKEENPKEYEYYYINKPIYEGPLTKSDVAIEIIKEESSFKNRLNYILNIMFNVDGVMDDGIEFNITNYDIFTTHHSKIALYLVYLASVLSKDKQLKSLLMH